MVQNPSSIYKSTKSAGTALILCLILGLFGVHRFYVGKTGTGLLMLITLGGLGIWFLVDLILIATNNFTDAQGNLLELTKNPSPSKKTFLGIGAAIVWAVSFVVPIILVVFCLTSGLVDTVENQLIALRSGDMVKAYSYNSKDFQNSTSLGAFEQFIDKYPSLKNNESYFFNNREIGINLGTLKGTLTAKDGAQTPIEYRLIKEGDTWKILSIDVVSSGAGVKINN